MLPLLKMTDVDLAGKRVLIREDFNVPLSDGKITNDRRIIAAIPTIEWALEAKAHVILMSHLGRPTEGQYNAQFSLAPVAKRLSELLNRPVTLKKDYLNGIDMTGSEIVLCENVRFNKGEKENDPALAKAMAKLCDVFVMDAFGTAHRAEASTTGVAEFAPIACGGPLLVSELEALTRALKNPQRPLLAIVGGSKVSTKLIVLKTLIEKVDQLIVGGGIANTFLAAAGYKVGKSLYEAALLDEAKQLMALAKKLGHEIPLPTDVVVAKSFSKEAVGTIKNIADVQDDEMILDIGPQTAKHFVNLISAAKTIVWNGPVGVFEFPEFSKGTHQIALAIANSKAYSLAGGGDTLAVIDDYHIGERISYISTGGGAFLEFMEGKTLPAVEILEKR